MASATLSWPILITLASKSHFNYKFDGGHERSFNVSSYSLSGVPQLRVTLLSSLLDLGAHDTVMTLVCSENLCELSISGYKSPSVRLLLSLL